MGFQPYSEDEVDPVLRQVCNLWIQKIKLAMDFKRDKFGKDAEACLAFFNGPKDWEDILMGPGGNNRDEVFDTTFRVSVNKAFEFVTIVGPALYFDNPVRTVKPRMPVIVPEQFFGTDTMTYQALVQQEGIRVQQDGLRSVLLEAYLNWTPSEFRFSKEARKAVDEALIKGRGCAWTELHSPPGSNVSVVRTEWGSVDDLLCDPDAATFGSGMWIAKRCVYPVWKWEADFGLPPGSLKGNCESQAKQADIEMDSDTRYNRKRGYTNDLLIAWKIYSKMGIGGRLQGLRKDYRWPLEIFGDYCYLVIADGTPYPLNLSPEVTTDPAFLEDPEAILEKVKWPTPFWGAGEWPVTELDFHEQFDVPWPLPHLKAGMGELKFLNWVMSFLMGKIRNTARDFIAIKKEAGEEIKTAILEGKDLTLLEIESDYKTISELVQFLQHPEVNGDIWKMLEAVENNFDKRVGLTDLMYGEGGGTQIRSAEEVKQRNSNMNVRPDDMRKQVEDWQARIALKEAICARYHIQGSDVQGPLGQMGSWAWDNFVITKDVYEACHQLEYRIEAGSTQRPNKNWEQQTMNTAFQQLAPVLQSYSQTSGDMAPLNNLVQDVAKALDLDPARYQMQSFSPMGATSPAAAADQGHQSPTTTNIPAPG